MNEKIRLLIAYDGSACSKEALHELGRAALPLECEASWLSVERPDHVGFACESNTFGKVSGAWSRDWRLHRFCKSDEPSYRPRQRAAMKCLIEQRHLYHQLTYMVQWQALAIQQH